MAGKAEALAKRFEGNMAESLGAREAGPPLALHTPPSEGTTPQDGFKRNKDSGLMELENIVPDPNQVRKEFNEQSLEELAASIKLYGVLSPILVEWNPELQKHVIIAGERRYRAAKMAGLTEVPCHFRNEGKLSDEVRMSIQIVENCLREDLSAVEQAHAFKSLMESKGLNQTQAAEMLCISKARITQRLALLDLSEDLQQKVHEGEVSGAVAYHVAKKADSPEKQKELIEEIRERGLAGSQAVDFVTSKAPKKKDSAAKAAPPKRKRSVTKKFKLTETGASVTILWPKGRMTREDELAVAEELVATLRAAMPEPRKSGKDAAVND